MMQSPSLRPRPTLPLLFLGALSLWIGIIVVLPSAFSWSFMIRVALIVVVSCWGVGFVFLVGTCRGFRLPLLVIFTGLLLGLGLSCLSSLQTDEARRAGLTQGGGECEFTLLEDARLTSMGNSDATAHVTLDSGKVVTVRVFLPEGSDLSYGDRFLSGVSFKAPSDEATGYYNQKGIALSCTAHRIEMIPDSSPLSLIGSLRKEALSVLGGGSSDAAVFLKAILFGERGELYQSDLYQEVKVVSLAHLVAVSGAHLVIVLAFVSKMLDILRIPRRIGVVVQVAFLCAYLVLVGMPISCLRASCMAGASLLAFMARRRSSALSALGLVIIVFLAGDPTLAYSVSFSLSAMATLGILLFMPLLMNWFDCIPLHIPRWITESFAMTLAATIPTFPISVSLFSQYSLIAPFANCIATPFLSFLLVAGVIAVLLQMVIGCPFLVDICLGVAGVFCEMMGQLSLVPHASIPLQQDLFVGVVVLGCSATALWLLWPRPAKKNLCILGGIVVAVLLVFSLVRIENDTEVVMLDVGQGDAFLVRSEGATLLMDTGNRPSDLLAALASCHVTDIDAIMISHADDDHCGSLRELKGIVGVDKLIMARGMQEVDSVKSRSLIDDAIYLVGEENCVFIEAGTTVHVGACDLDIIAPASFTDNGENADSICALLSTDLDGDGMTEWKTFFCGDAECEQIHALIEKGSLDDVDVLKVGHHGSKASLDEETLSVLKPEVALVSVGAGNRYGHPAESVLSLLGERGTHVARSDEMGSVVCNFTDRKIEVSSLG